MKNSKRIIVMLAATMLTACAGPNGGGITKQDIGTVAGGVGGGVLGSTIGQGEGKTAATIGGTLLGGLLGNSVGKSLDNADRAGN